MVNKIWGLFLVLGITYSFVTNNFSINDTIIKSADISFNMLISIFPFMALWLGIMNIALKSGLLNKLSSLLSPMLSFIFPDIPKNHESLSLIASNFIINTFGLGNAATPFGLKAMKSLQELNKSDTASKSMITFLVINTTGITLIPTTIISLRMLYGSSNPEIIVIPSIIVSVISLVLGLIIDRMFHE